MRFLSSRIRNLVLCSAAAVAILPAASFAGGRWDKDRKHDVDVRVDIDLSRGRFPHHDQRIWVEPVYRTVCDRVWVEPVYRDVCDRVWHEPVYETRIERVWCEPRYEYRDVVKIDFMGNRIRARDRVCLEQGHWDDREARVCVREGFWEDVTRRELVCAGYWKTIERRECVSEGYWTTRHGHGDRYAKRDRGNRYRD